MTLYWLSFCDPDQPRGSAFLGVSVVKADDFLAAVESAHATGCNPGGEVQGSELPEQLNVPDDMTHRLLSRDEAMALDSSFRKQLAH